jgi:hypothetical protein
MLMRISDAAKLAGCSRQNIHYHIDAGNLKLVIAYGVKLVNSQEIHRFFATVKPRGQKRKKG